MQKSVCPECGCRYRGTRCRHCGYESFAENRSAGKSVTPKGPKRRHPFLWFLILLALIAALMPVLRNWGLELEEIEQSHTASEKENLYG